MENHIQQIIEKVFTLEPAYIIVILSLSVVIIVLLIMARIVFRCLDYALNNDKIYKLKKNLLNKKNK